MAVVTEFATLLRSYGVSCVVGDRYAGEWPRERFAAHGIRCEPSVKNKSELHSELRPLVNAKRIELLDLPRLTAQLVSLERRTARGGRATIDHPPGAHDDLANAVAGAIVEAASRRAGLGPPTPFLVPGDTESLAEEVWKKALAGGHSQRKSLTASDGSKAVPGTHKSLGSHW